MIFDMSDFGFWLFFPLFFRGNFFPFPFFMLAARARFSWGVEPALILILLSSCKQSCQSFSKDGSTPRPLTATRNSSQAGESPSKTVWTRSSSSVCTPIASSLSLILEIFVKKEFTDSSGPIFKKRSWLFNSLFWLVALVSYSLTRVS